MIFCHSGKWMTNDECCFVCWHIPDIQALQLYLPCANGACFRWNDETAKQLSLSWSQISEMERVWMVVKVRKVEEPLEFIPSATGVCMDLLFFLLGTFPDPMSGGTHLFQKSVWSFGLYSKQPSWGQNLETRHQYGLRFGFGFMAIRPQMIKNDVPGLLQSGSLCWLFLPRFCVEVPHESATICAFSFNTAPISHV